MRSGYCSNAEPASLRFTFLAGQPMLISISCAPFATLMTAAAAISAGSQPAIFTAWIPGLSLCTMRKRDLSVRHNSGLEESISETVIPAPIA